VPRLATEAPKKRRIVDDRRQARGGFFLTVTVRVFLYGLMLFDLKSSPVRILLPAASGLALANDGCPVAQHTAGLFYLPDDSGTCDDDCPLDSGLCHCPLQRQSVSIGGNGLKAMPGQMVLSMSQVGYMNGDDVLSDDCSKTIQNNACPLIRVEATIKPSDIVACEMEASYDVPSQDAIFDVTALTGATKASGMAPETSTQPLARILLFQAVVDGVAGGATSLGIKLTPFSGQAEDSIDIPIIGCDSASGKCVDLLLANLMSTRPPPEGCRDSGIGRHFLWYHTLMNKPQDAQTRKVPRRTKGSSTSPQPVDCSSSSLYQQIHSLPPIRSGTHVMICPMAAVP